MTDEEINEAVARKLGWHQPTEGANWVNFEGKSMPDLGIYDFTYYPDYCHSIQAAWEIVEMTHKNGFTIRFSVARNTWIAGYGDYGDDLDPQVEADTAPMAICLAFLKCHKMSQQII